MVFTNLNRFQVKKTELSITPHAGLALFGRLLKQLKLFEKIDAGLDFKKRDRGFHPLEIVKRRIIFPFRIFKILSNSNMIFTGSVCLHAMFSAINPAYAGIQMHDTGCPLSRA